MEIKKTVKSILTPKEIEVINLLINGYNNIKISEELCISEQKTKEYILSVYKKLNVSNRVQATVKYLLG